MNESLILAKLTLMLMRASVPRPDELTSGHGIVILPETAVLSEEEALKKIGELGGPLALSGAIEGGNLVISPARPTLEDQDWLEYTMENFGGGLRDLNEAKNQEALVEVRGFRDSMVVPARIIERWLTLVYCQDCSMSLSKPTPGTASGAIAVLALGDGDVATSLESSNMLEESLLSVRRTTDSALQALEGRDAVELLITDLPTQSANTRRWLATYGALPHLAEFELDLAVPAVDPVVGITVFGIIRRHSSASDLRPLLTALATAHGVQYVTVSTARRDSITFQGVLMGASLSRQRSVGTGGHFSARPSGTWLVCRITLAPNELRASQIVLALSPETGQGAIIPLDKEQAPGVMSAFMGLMLK